MNGVWRTQRVSSASAKLAYAAEKLTPDTFSWCWLGGTRAPTASCLPLIICSLLGWRWVGDVRRATCLGRAALGGRRTPSGLTRWLLCSSLARRQVPGVREDLLHTCKPHKTPHTACRRTHTCESKHLQAGWEEVSRCTHGWREVWAEKSGK